MVQTASLRRELILNVLLGWWWTDALASLVIVYYGIHEGVHALRESAGTE